MEADDFKLIHGIGPGLERRLHAAGVHTFAQLAALSPAELAALLGERTGLSAARIAQQNWIGQARELAPAEANDEAHGETAQHYATFMVKLLLDQDNSVRRTHVVHVHSGTEDTWAGWQDLRLRDFIAPHADLPPAEVSVGRSTESEEFGGVAVLAGGATTLTDVAAAPARPNPAVAGAVRLDELRTLTVGATAPNPILLSSQPYDIQLRVGLSEVEAPPNAELGYQVAVWAHSLDGRAREEVGQVTGVTGPGDHLTITVPGTRLPANIYRLEAVVSLGLPHHEPSMWAVLEGGLLQVL